MSNLLNNITQSRQTLPSDATSNAYVSSVDDSKATNTYVNSTFTTESYVDAEVASIVNSAPATLDTLNELAAALGDDPNFATTVTNTLATKVDETHTGDVTIDGKVGIGTTSPASTLTVHPHSASTQTQLQVYNDNTNNDFTDNSYIAAESTQRAAILQLKANSSYFSRIEFGDAADADAGSVNYEHSNNMMSFKTNGVGSRVVIDSSGNVGIGTSSPSSKLHTTDHFRVARSTVAPAIFLENSSYSGGDARITMFNEGQLLFFTDDTERMTIDSSGDVGIGTSSPATELDVNGTIQDAQGNVRALERVSITSTPYALPAGSTGKYFSMNAGSSELTLDAANIGSGGSIITVLKMGGGTATISWTNMINGVYIAGVSTNLGSSGSVTLADKGLVTILTEASARLIFSGNVS